MPRYQYGCEAFSVDAAILRNTDFSFQWHFRHGNRWKISHFGVTLFEDTLLNMRAFAAVILLCGFCHTGSDKQKQIPFQRRNSAKKRRNIGTFNGLHPSYLFAPLLRENSKGIVNLYQRLCCYAKKTITADKLEAVFQTNYLSTFILNYYLKQKLINQNSGRILFVNSEAHRFAAWGLNLDDLAWEKHAYTGLKSYGTAKLAQLLSMIKLNEHFAGTGVTVNAMHPGNVKTNSGQNNGPIYKFFKKIFVDKSAQSADIAAEALYYLGVSKDLENVSGKFFNLTSEEEPAPPALDKDAAEELWALSCELGGVK